MTRADIETYTRLQAEFDKQDIENYFNKAAEDGADIQEKFGISAGEAQELIPEIAREYRAYIDNDDTWDAERNLLRTYAVWDVIDKYKEAK